MSIIRCFILNINALQYFGDSDFRNVSASTTTVYRNVKIMFSNRFHSVWIH